MAGEKQNSIPSGSMTVSRPCVKSSIRSPVSIPSKRGSGRLRPKTEQRYQLGMSKPDFQPTLIGPTVIIRPVVAEDWPELFDAGSDPQIWKVHPSPDRYTEPAFRKFFDGAVASKMGFVFVDRATNRLIGSSRYHGAMTKIGGVRRSGLFTREATGTTPYFIFEIGKDEYEQGGRALVE